MKKLSDYKGQKIAIHFTTYELWLRRKEINPSDKCEDNYWYINRQDTCYFVDYRKEGNYGSLEFAKDGGYTILPATDFLEEVLEEEFFYGQEYEFYSNNTNRFKEKYLCKTPDGKFVSYDGATISLWYYCRKINTERNEAITTAKELITKFDIKQEELFNN